MKKLLTFLLAAFILSCTSEDTTLNENLTDQNPKEKIYEELSYIINDKKLTMNIDITDEENTFVVKTEDSDIILSYFEKESPVFYYNPEIENLVLFDDYKDYSSFIKNKTNVKNLKNKFKIKKTYLSKGLETKTASGPVSGATPRVTIYKDINYNGTSYNFPLYSPDYIYNNYHAGYTPVGDDKISSIEVVNAYAGFWRNTNFGGYLLIVDSYNYHTQIPNLKDAKLKSYTIFNGSSSSSNYCGWLCSKNWNDRISSFKVRGNGSRVF